MISVYGQRATMVSFSAPFYFIGFAHLQTGWDILQYSGLLLTGGLFYLLVSLIFYYIRPHRYVGANLTMYKINCKVLKTRGTYGNSIQMGKPSLRNNCIYKCN
jgi:hypothetical protein